MSPDVYCGYRNFMGNGYREKGEQRLMVANVEESQTVYHIVNNTYSRVICCSSTGLPAYLQEVGDADPDILQG